MSEYLKSVQGLARALSPQHFPTQFSSRLQTSSEGGQSEAKNVS